MSLIETGLGGPRTVGSEDVLLPDIAGERPAFIAETVTRWKQEHKPHGAVIGLPLENFSHQLIVMPAMKRADLRMALLFDLEKFLPLSVEEYLFDFIWTPGDPGELKVLVLAVRKDIVNAYCRSIIEAGLEVLSVRCSTIESLYSVKNAAAEKDLNGIFVNITDRAVEIVGLKDSVPVYMKNFLSEIDLSAELDRLVESYPGSVYFLGDPGQLVVERFAGRKFHISPAHAVASSYAKKPRVNLEFIPSEMLKPAMDYYPYLIGSLAGATLILFLMTGLLAYYKESRTLGEIETKRASIKARASKVLASRKKLEQLLADRSVLFEFTGRSNVAVKAFSDLSNVLPKDAWLINLSVDDKGKIEMEGFSANTAKLVVDLEKSKEFRNVSFSAPIIAKEGEERFALKAEVEGVEK